MSSLVTNKSPKIFAIVNQKGGVGKTTTAINLGTALAAVDRKVLIIDMDPQGNASTGLGVNPEQRVKSSYDLLLGPENLQECIVHTALPGLDIICSTVELSGADMELIEVDRRTHRLYDMMRARSGDILPTACFYDYILIDCPPSLNLLTVNAMVAASAVLVPLQCEFFALEGLSQLLTTVKRVQANLNPGLEIQGVVLTMFDRRNNLSGQVADDVREYLGDIVYETVIPRNVRVSEAPSHGMPALLYDHACSGSRAYISLASEVLRREEDLDAA